MKRIISKISLITTLLIFTMVSFAASAAASAESQSWIVISNKSRLPHNLVSQVEALGGTVTRTMPQIGALAVTSNDPSFASAAAAINGVRSVVPNIEMQLVEPTEVVPLVSSPPNTGDDDFFYDLQWGHDAIDVPEAWTTGARGNGVRVAVLDSGIDAEHPDLAANLNTALSYSFVPGESFNINPGFYFNHGTHVAGIIAAADNALGMIGVAPEAEIVAVKVLSEFTGSGTFDGVAAGIVYAADINADIINMSLGAGPIPRNPDEGIEELWFLMGRVTSYAHRHGTTVIAAAGNAAFDLDVDDPMAIYLPAMSPFVQAISATAPIGWATDPSNTFLDNISSFSNIGKRIIHFAAPGGDFIYPGNENCVIAGLLRPCWVFDLVFSTISEGWGWAAGTSMAAPHAAGVAALIIGENGGSMHPNAVIHALKNSSDDLGPAGFDKYYGYGRVNAYNAVAP